MTNGDSGRGASAPSQGYQSMLAAEFAASEEDLADEARIAREWERAGIEDSDLGAAAEGGYK